MKHGKHYVDAAKLVDSTKAYDVNEALELACKTASAKFDETVELHVRLGVDGRHADQQVRGAVVLPNGTGKTVRVCAIAKGAAAAAAEAAGADIVGDDELIARIAGGFMDFDVVVTTPDMMGRVGRLGKVLGPRGLMPNPKAGTVTPDIGKAVTEAKAADGSTGTVKTDKYGKTEAAAKLSDKAIEDAKKNGEAVKAPVEVEASRNSSTAPTVKVELPKGAGETKVDIPVSNANSGTVAVLVHPDGTEEVVKNSLPTENGIQLTVNGGATVKIVDNSKDFADTQNHWAKDAIDFVSARSLVNGMNETTYAPDSSTTRAQLWTILARQNGADLTGGNTWYEKAQNWAKDKGVSDGANPNAAINRAQMVTMLWRAMGQPAAASGASFADVPADSYYAQAVAWAVENGITTGIGNGKFNPNATCTRAQIAAFLARSMK